jgi:hypothetical protein
MLRLFARRAAPAVLRQPTAPLYGQTIRSYSDAGAAGGEEVEGKSKVVSFLEALVRIAPHPREMSLHQPVSSTIRPTRVISSSLHSPGDVTRVVTRTHTGVSSIERVLELQKSRAKINVE